MQDETCRGASSTEEALDNHSVYSTGIQRSTQSKKRELGELQHIVLNKWSETQKCIEGLLQELAVREASLKVTNAGENTSARPGMWDAHGENARTVPMKPDSEVTQRVLAVRGVDSGDVNTGLSVDARAR
ncbi:UNVERIFIED_CONTAM: hypothetical protein FKN15_065724 [Acipenser sinensis]